MRWVHTIEKMVRQGVQVDESETRLLDHIRDLFTEFDLIEKESASLAANIGWHYASFYDETWVWGITPRIAALLREMAGLCEESDEGVTSFDFVDHQSR